MIYGYSLGVLVQWIDWFDRPVLISIQLFYLIFLIRMKRKLTQLASTDYELKKLEIIDLNFLLDGKGCKKFYHINR